MSILVEIYRNKSKYNIINAWVYSFEHTMANVLLNQCKEDGIFNLKDVISCCRNHWKVHLQRKGNSPKGKKKCQGNNLELNMYLGFGV